jgi:hypothetical protein
MNPLAIFTLQFILSVIVIATIARWEISPRLAQRPLKEALFWLTLPHAFRHVGLVFLVPGVVAEPLPDHFALPAAYGDLTSALLAFFALVALRSGWRIAIPAVWLFSVIGSVDLINALRQAEVVPDLGAAWYIPTFFVPLLLVTHYMIFARLLRRPEHAGETTDLTQLRNSS